MASKDGLPRARGLGSSSTARIAGLLAFLESTGLRPPEHEVLAFLTAEEGHPDNALPSYLGGLVTCMTEGGEVSHRRLPLGADFEIVLCIPDRLVPTQQARAVLPAHPPLADAVFNLQRLALLVAGFLTGDLEAIRMGASDRLHQLQRALSLIHI